MIARPFALKWALTEAHVCDRYERVCVEIFMRIFCSGLADVTVEWLSQDHSTW